MNLMTLKSGAVQSDTSKTLTLPVEGLTPSTFLDFFGHCWMYFMLQIVKRTKPSKGFGICLTLLFGQNQDFGNAWQAKPNQLQLQMWMLMRSNWTKDSFSGFLDPIKGFNNTYNRPRPLHKGPKVDAVRKGDQYLFASTILGNIRFSCWIKYS